MTSRILRSDLAEAIHLSSLLSRPPHRGLISFLRPVRGVSLRSTPTLLPRGRLAAGLMGHRAAAVGAMYRRPYIPPTNN